MRYLVISFLLFSCSASTDPICRPGETETCECGYAGFQQYGVAICEVSAWGHCYCDPVEAGTDSK